jgi:two-component system chemotaxis response regulator CheB
MLGHIVGQATDMIVVGEAQNGQQAVSMTEELHPDVILMDSVMPVMGGVDATKEIMHRTPTPIIVISASLEEGDTQTAFEALRAGALHTLRKPVGPTHKDHADQVNGLLSTLRAMASVKVIRHRRARAVPTVATVAQRPAVTPKIVGIVSSTGGPGALAEILKGLPETFPLPIVIVQHMAPDFVPSLKTWLSGVAKLKIKIAGENEVVQTGHVYIAPGFKHLTMNTYERFSFQDDNGESLHIPSGDVLLASLSRSYQAQAIGIVLTGMGSDGARGLKMMCDAGAYTIAQDAQSSVVYGMPKEAVAQGGVRQVLPLAQIAEHLLSLTNASQGD